LKRHQQFPGSILVVRNDKLGDFVLALPSFRLLKKALPNTRIVALVPSYTADIARQCMDIDEVIIDPGKGSGLQKTLKLILEVRKFRFDAVVTLFSTFRVGIMLALSRIPYRLAPATKIAQIFYNHKLVQRRSKSEKPEYQYNTDLIQTLLKDGQANVKSDLSGPYLKFSDEEAANAKAEFVETHQISNGRLLVFMHPGHGGSASNLPLDRYAELGRKLVSTKGHIIIISAGPDEIDIARQLALKLGKIPHVIYHSTNGLIPFCKHIQFADVFIGGSTGPLHIAGALDVPTAAFYPRGRVTSALRWQTLSSKEKRLAFFPPEGASETDMAAIDIDEVAATISKTYLS